MSVPIYNREKYFRIMDNAQMNFANQYKRLSKNEKRGSSIIIYYSIALIIYTISSHFYGDFFDAKWSAYSSVILSVIVLIYSLTNSKANYSDRMAKSSKFLDEIKRLKRAIAQLPDMAFVYSKTEEMDEEIYKNSHQQLKDIMSQYDEIMTEAEVRDDIDFYYTIKTLGEQYGINIYKCTEKGNFQSPFIAGSTTELAQIRSEIYAYISENHPKKQRLHLFFLTILHIFLYIAPVIIFLIGIVLKFFTKVS